MITRRFIVTLGLAAIAVVALSTLYLGTVPPEREWESLRQKAGIVVSVTASFCVLCISIRRLCIWGNDWRTVLTIVTAPVAAGMGFWVLFAWS